VHHFVLHRIRETQWASRGFLRMAGRGLRLLGCAPLLTAIGLS
jgi:hypothetical protein